MNNEYISIAETSVKTSKPGKKMKPRFIVVHGYSGTESMREVFEKAVESRITKKLSEADSK